MSSDSIVLSYEKLITWERLQQHVNPVTKEVDREAARKVSQIGPNDLMHFREVGLLGREGKTYTATGVSAILGKPFTGKGEHDHSVHSSSREAVQTRVVLGNPDMHMRKAPVVRRHPDLDRLFLQDAICCTNWLHWHKGDLYKVRIMDLRKLGYTQKEIDTAWVSMNLPRDNTGYYLGGHLRPEIKVKRR